MSVKSRADHFARDSSLLDKGYKSQGRINAYKSNPLDGWRLDHDQKARLHDGWHGQNGEKLKNYNRLDDLRDGKVMKSEINIAVTNTYCNPPQNQSH